MQKINCVNYTEGLCIATTILRADKLSHIIYYNLFLL